jgi:hypothetical protein
MAKDPIPLSDHLNGLIYLAEMAWQGPPEKYADMARTFQQFGRAYEIEALNKRAN